MISLEKWWILKTLQKLPKNVGYLDKLIVAKRFEKWPKVQKSPNLVTLPIRSTYLPESYLPVPQPKPSNQMRLWSFSNEYSTQSLTWGQWLCHIWQRGRFQPVWPDWAIYCTLGNFSKPVATIILPKSPTFLYNFCEGFKNFHFSSEIILGNSYWHLSTL